MAEKGSRIFPDTVPFQKKHADKLRAKMDKYLAQLGLQSVGVGSTSDPDRDPEELASDLDTMVDLDDVIRQLNPRQNPADKKDTIEKAARRSLAAAIEEMGLQTSQTGVNVFVRMPYGSHAHQIDLECIRKVSKVSRYHQHRIPRGSPYKGVSKQLMIAILAKQKGYVYSAWEGLYVRTPENKKGELVADDWDDIAKVLLGDTATGENLSSVEAILKSLPTDQAQTLLARAKEDKNWVERKPTAESVFAKPTDLDWFKNISQKISL
jgi:hypothetical protein